MEIRFPLSFPFQLGGAEPPQRAKDPVADQRQQLEGDEVVARLLGIAQHARAPVQTRPPNQRESGSVKRGGKPQQIRRLHSRRTR